MPQVEPFLVWKGKLTGTASVHETKASSPNSVEMLDGEGPVLTIAGGYEPTMSIIVDTRTCTYKMTAATTLSLRRSNSSGGSFTLESPVATVQATYPLGDWKAPRTLRPGGRFVSRASLLWLGAHPNDNGFAALGFATELTQRSFEEPPVGAATVSYAITRK